MIFEVVIDPGRGEETEIELDGDRAHETEAAPANVPRNKKMRIAPSTFIMWLHRTAGAACSPASALRSHPLRVACNRPHPYVLRLVLR